MIEQRLGEITKMSFTLTRGCEWHAKDLIKFRQRVYVEFSDGSVEPFRIRKVTKNTNGLEDVRVECWALWADLNQTYVKYILAPTEEVSYAVPLTSVTFANAINNIVFNADYGIDDFFTVDSIDASVSSNSVNISLDSHTHLALIYSLCESAGSEFDPVYNSGTNQYEFVFDDEIGGGTAGASTRPLHTGKATGANRISLDVRDENPDYYSRIIPVAGRPDERITVAGAAFAVQSVALKTGSRYWVEVEAGVLLDDEMFDVSGSRYFYVVTDLDATTYQIYSVDTANDRFEVEGDPTGASTVTFYVYEDADAALLSYIPDKAAEDDYGVVEKVVEFTNVVPVENLFETVGGSGDMSSGSTIGSDWVADGMNIGNSNVTQPVIFWQASDVSGTYYYRMIRITGDFTSVIADTDTIAIWGQDGILSGNYTVSGTPTFTAGYTEIETAEGTVSVDDAGTTGPSMSYTGSPTTAENTDAFRVKYGTSSMKVTADYAGMYVFADFDFTQINPTALEPYFSVVASLSVESGSVRVFIEGSAGEVWPPGPDHAGSSSNSTYAIKIGGVAIPEGPVNIVVRAMEDGTVFYLDSLTFTQTATSWEYSPVMGKVALWKQGVAEMLYSGGAKDPILTGDFWDVAELDGGGWDAVELGDYVEVRDLPDAGGYLMSYNARVQAIKRYPDGRWGEIKKKVSLTRKANTLAKELRPKTSTRIAPLPSPPILSGVGSTQIIETVGEFATSTVDTLIWNDDGRGGVFKKDTSLSGSDSDGGTVFASADGNAYVRQGTDNGIEAVWFGVVADYDTGGSFDNGTDNYAALRSAVTVAGSTGKTLYLPPGDIKTNTCLTFTHSEAFRVVGAGKYVTTIYAINTGVASLTPILKFDGSVGSSEPMKVELHDFAIDGDDDELLVGCYFDYCSHFSSSSNVRAKKCWDGFRFADCWNLTFRDFEALNNLNYGFNVGYDMSGTQKTCNALRFFGGRAAGNVIHGFSHFAGANIILDGMDCEGNKGLGVYSNRALGISLNSVYAENLADTYSAWANSTAYVRGDRVTESYGGHLLTFVCILDHTSATATDKPKSGSSWTTKWARAGGYYFFSGRAVGINGQTHNIWADNTVMYWFDASTGSLNGVSMSRGTDPTDPNPGTFMFAEAGSYVSIGAADFRACEYGVRLHSGASVTWMNPRFVGVDIPVSSNNSTGNAVFLIGWDEDDYNRCDFGFGETDVTSVSDASGEMQCVTTAAHSIQTGDEVYARGTVNAEGLYTATRIDANNFTLDGSTYVGTDAFKVTAPHRGTSVRRSVETNDATRFVENIEYTGLTKTERLVTKGWLELWGPTPSSGGYGGGIEVRNAAGSWTEGPAMLAYQEGGGGDADRQGWKFLVHPSTTFADARALAMSIDPDGYVIMENALRLKDNTSPTGKSGYLTIYSNASGEPYVRIGTAAGVPLGGVNRGTMTTLTTSSAAGTDATIIDNHTSVLDDILDALDAAGIVTKGT